MTPCTYKPDLHALTHRLYAQLCGFGPLSPFESVFYGTAVASSAVHGYVVIVCMKDLVDIVC